VGKGAIHLHYLIEAGYFDQIRYRHAELRGSRRLYQLPMFIGEFTHSIDEKGRVSIPGKFRAELKKGAVVTRGLDNCLFLYTKQEWREHAKKLAALPISQSNTRAFARLMLAGAMDVKIDSQGRILVPEYLRQFGDFKKEVVVTGLFNRLELWDKAKWNKYKAGTEKDSVKIAEQLGELGI